MFPWSFHKRSTGQAEEKSEATATREVLTQARFDRIEGQLAILRTEWEETYDKIMHLYDRTRKRIQVLQKLQDAENTVTDESTPSPVQLNDRQAILVAYDHQNGAN